MRKLSDETTYALRKIQELVAYREEQINKKSLPMVFRYACKKVGISPYTVRRFAPELYEKWENIEFHWEMPPNSQTSGNPDPAYPSEKL